MDKLSVLLISLREIATQIVAAVEDYLGTPYEKSALAKRRQKVREESHG